MPLLSLKFTVKTCLRKVFGKNFVCWLLYARNKILNIDLFQILHTNDTNVFYFYISPKLKHPGLADRLKAIISCYYIAKQNGYQFKIIFNNPFHLDDFLKPNKVDWTTTEKRPACAVIDTCLFDYYRNFHRLKHDKHYVCYNYIGEDLISEDFLLHWRELFNELFRVSDDINNTINAYPFHKDGYIAIHLRFLNALGSFENNHYKPLEKKQQQELIERCHNAIKNICNKHTDLPVLVFSDSAYFLQSLSALPVHTLGSQNISHISFSSNNESVRKTFVDLLMISRAYKIYRIVSPEMYKSEFPIVAGRIEDKEVQEIVV